MALVINSNIASLQAQKNLSNTQNAQASTFQRLSTGLRINSAKDDAGGLFLAESQTKDIRGLNMATRNAGDGISMAQTAEGALDQIGKNLQRVNELAIQSANGTYSAEARGGLQKEVDQLTQEISRIVETTEFNGNKLLSKDAKSETLQISFNDSAGARIKTGMEGGLVKQEGINSKTFLGSSKNFNNITGATSANAAVVQEFAKVVGLDGTNASSVTLVGTTMSAELTGKFNQALTSLQGSHASLGAAVLEKAGSETSYTHKFEVDGMAFSVQFDATGNAAEAKDVNVGAAGIKATYAGTALEFNGSTALGANKLDKASAQLTASTAVTGGAGATAIAVADANAFKDVIAGGLNGELTVNISDQANAQNAITQTRNAIDMVSEIRAEFGANQNRFESVISGNQTYTENLSSARSRIQDADFAVETANLAKLQVLQQAGTSILGQANASGQSVLGLL